MQLENNQEKDEQFSCVYSHMLLVLKNSLSLCVPTQLDEVLSIASSGTVTGTVMLGILQVVGSVNACNWG